MDAFGMCEEAKVPGENPHRQGESMHTPWGTATESRDSNARPSCCKAGWLAQLIDGIGVDLFKIHC